MYNYTKFYIDGAWVEPEVAKELDVINPATEEAIGKISLGGEADVNKAVAAARAAFETYSETTVEERLGYLQKIVEGYQKRLPDMAAAITAEMGAPKYLADNAQAPSALAHFMGAIEILKNFEFEEKNGSALIVKEPAGVCGLITPWNWPINQIACKVAPALAVGCTMVLKPSEIAPLDAYILAEIIDEAGLPKGVFNLVNGDGPGVGSALTQHPDVDLVSFTGSTRAGVMIAKNAADTVKRVAQELGGKSANIILDDANIAEVVGAGVVNCFMNSGQSCLAPTRMLIPEDKMDEAIAVAKAAAEGVIAGDPNVKGTTIGPVASDVQFSKIQSLIEKGVEEGATLVTGGPGKPDGLDKGYYVKPTVFANVTNEMTIAREEIFGPVLSMIPYKDEADAIKIANDTEYGLSGYISSGDLDRARKVARKIRTGNVHLNGAPVDFNSPFGGYKKSGTGREWGKWGFEEYLETKAILGYNA